MALDLSTYKPVPNTLGDASQIAGGFTTIESYVNGGLPASSIAQSGATTGQALVWNGTMWAPGTISVPSVGGAELDYKQVTANSAAISATTEATAVAIVTGNSVAYDGTRVKLEFFCASVWANPSALVTCVYYRDATVMGQTKHNMTGSGGFGVEVVGVLFDTPAAGAHTYKVGAYVGANAATFQAGAGGSGVLLPAYLRVTKA